MLENRLKQDIKTALLAGDSAKATTLRGLHANLLDVKIKEGKRESGLTDEEVLKVFAKESKKRHESAELYKQGGSAERADKELAEKAIIDAYLPEQLSEDAVLKLIDEAITQTGASSMAEMGKVIGAVKGKAGSTADGALIAKLVKEQLS
ncbi:MAG: GatB/YqeY domain-containing protein [bacterium]